MSGDKEDIVRAFERRYDRIYDPVANAQAIDEQNAQVARRARLAALYGSRKPRD